MKSKLIFLFLGVLILGLFLRLFQLGQTPPSLNWDEASLGYNAYTILTSGKDEHGEVLPLDRFIAFGDFKPPGYIYAAVPSIFIFGPNDFAVRFPSAVAGFFLIIVAFLLTNELTGSKKAALFASFLTAVDPYTVHFSRAAFEANLAAALNAFAVYFFLVSRRKNIFLPVSFIFFILSFYTFNANRIIAPLLLGFLLIYYFRSTFKNWRWLIFSIIISLILIFPSIRFLTDRESRVRFQEVSIFNNLDIIKTSNQRIALENNSPVAKFIFNRRILYALDFAKHATDNLNPRFIFIDGDPNPRLSVDGVGLLYIFEIPFLLIGIYQLIVKKRNSAILIFFWAAIALIPAGTAKETPHALRTISILPIYQMISAFGIFISFLYIKLKSPKIYFPTALLFTLIVMGSIYYYLHMYFIHYPLKWPDQWQYGYKQMVDYVLKNENKYQHVYVTPDYGRPYIYFAFYKPYSLDEFITNRQASRDWFGFWTVSKLGKVNFDIPNHLPTTGKILVVTQGDIPSEFRPLSSIKDPEGNIVFQFSERKWKKLL